MRYPITTWTIEDEYGLQMRSNLNDPRITDHTVREAVQLANHIEESVYLMACWIREDEDGEDYSDFVTIPVNPGDKAMDVLSYTLQTLGSQQ